MTLLADVFPKLPNSKEIFREMSKRSRIGRPLGKRYGKRPKHC